MYKYDNHVSPDDTFYKGINHSIPIFAIMGKTGVGKSKFIQVLGGENITERHQPEVGHGLESCGCCSGRTLCSADLFLGTSNIAIYEATVNGEAVYLMDTPGFDDSGMTSDTQILYDIFNDL